MLDIPAIVFDLDDTLYKERDYAASCLRWAGSRMTEIIGVDDPAEKMLSLFAGGHSDPVGAVCRELQISQDIKSDLIRDMRSHLPEISLSKDAEALLAELRSRRIPFSIVTNGRSLTQRQKIKSLALDDAASISISEETGFAKPDRECFSLAIKAHDAKRYVYIGDNPAHDFFGPNQLGWTTIMVKDDGRNIHPQDINVDDQYGSTHQVDSLHQIVGMLKML